MSSYELHHEQGDFEGFLKLLPMIIALFAVQQQPIMLQWCIMGMQSLLHLMEHRRDMMRMLCLEAQSLNEAGRPTPRPRASAAPLGCVHAMFTCAGCTDRPARRVLL